MNLLQSILKFFVPPKVYLLLFAISLLGGVTGCKSSNEEVAPVNTGEYISYKIDGKEYSDNTLNSPTASTDNFGLWSFIVISANMGYDLKLYVDNPKVGTFTTQGNKLTGEFSYLKSATDIQTYNTSISATSTLTFTAYNKDAYAEGTFSFIGKKANGQTVTITDGKFRMNLN